VRKGRSTYHSRAVVTCRRGMAAVRKSLGEELSTFSWGVSYIVTFVMAIIKVWVVVMV